MNTLGYARKANLDYEDAEQEARLAALEAALNGEDPETAQVVALRKMAAHQQQWRRHLKAKTDWVAECGYWPQEEDDDLPDGSTLDYVMACRRAIAWLHPAERARLRDMIDLKTWTIREGYRLPFRTFAETRIAQRGLLRRINNLIHKEMFAMRKEGASR